MSIDAPSTGVTYRGLTPGTAGSECFPNRRRSGFRRDGDLGKRCLRLDLFQPENVGLRARVIANRSPVHHSLGAENDVFRTGDSSFPGETL